MQKQSSSCDVFWVRPITFWSTLIHTLHQPSHTENTGCLCMFRSFLHSKTWTDMEGFRFIIHPWCSFHKNDSNLLWFLTTRVSFFFFFSINNEACSFHHPMIPPVWSRKVPTLVLSPVEELRKWIQHAECLWLFLSVLLLNPEAMANLFVTCSRHSPRTSHSLLISALFPFPPRQ